MNLFEVIDYKIIISTEAHQVPEFQKLLDLDTSKTKTKSIGELTYVYQIADYKSVYNNYPPSIKDKKLKEDIFKDINWKPSDDVLEAIRKYKELQETPTLRLLKGARAAAEEVNTYYQSLKDTPHGVNSKNVQAVMGSLEKIGKVVDSLDKLEEKVKKELNQEGKSKGNRTINSFEV